MESFYQNASLVEKIVLQDKPASILEISCYNCCYGKLFADCMERYKCTNKRLDRIYLSDDINDNAPHVYDNIYESKTINNIDSLSDYDMIFVAHLIENSIPDAVIDIIGQLQYKVNNRILIMTTEYPYDLSGNTEYTDDYIYNPGFFEGFLFAHYIHEVFEGKWQFYSIFNPGLQTIERDADNEQ